MKRFINNLLQRGSLPVSYRQFWRYALLFWGTLAVISYIQNTLAWLLLPNQPMHLSESVQWLVTYLMWLGFTPLILYAAQRFPVRLTLRTYSIARTVLVHVLIASAFGLLVAAVSYALARPVHAYETGRWMKPATILIWFFYGYSLSVITYLLVVLGYSILTYTYHNQLLQEQNHAYELNNEQLKNQLTNAQLQSLKMQLNPHFLFNTHHAIVSLMLQNENRKAIDMVTALSDLLRGVLAKQDANFLPLHDELNLTRQYLAIQQIRFQDRLCIEYDIDPATETCPVPQLLLQPLVENAVTHGISGLTTGALIRIATRMRSGGLQISVYDNGVGNRAGCSGGTGLGLSNTRSRLEQAYGDKAQLTFEQPPGEGTTVTLVLPYESTRLTTNNHDNLSLAHH